MRTPFKIPLLAAAAIPAAAYAVRSAMRGSIAPDLPGDLVGFGLLVIVLALVGTVRASARDSAKREFEDKPTAGDHAEGDGGHDEQV